MLVLSRKLNEEIVIDGHIRVQILEIRGGRIKLGIVAPANVNVRRGDLPIKMPASTVATTAAAPPQGTLAATTAQPLRNNASNGAGRGKTTPEFADQGFIVREPYGEYAAALLACAG